MSIVYCHIFIIIHRNTYSLILLHRYSQSDIVRAYYHPTSLILCRARFPYIVVRIKQNKSIIVTKALRIIFQDVPFHPYKTNSNKIRRSCKQCLLFQSSWANSQHTEQIIIVVKMYYSKQYEVLKYSILQSSKVVYIMSSCATIR